MLEATLDYHQQHGYFWPHAWCLGLMAEAAMLVEDREQSLELYQQSLAGFNDHGVVYATLNCLIAITSHAIAFGDAETAASLLGVVGRLRASVGYRMTWTTVSEEEANASALAELGAEQFSAVQEISRSLQLTETVERALAVQPGERVSVAGVPGSARSFGLTVREIEVLRCLTEGMGN